MRIMLIRPRSGHDKIELSIAERENYLWTASEKYMQGLMTPEELSEIEQEYDKCSLLDTPPPQSVTSSIFGFVGNLFR
jgi:hypothetical protein